MNIFFTYQATQRSSIAIPALLFVLIMFSTAGCNRSQQVAESAVPISAPTTYMEVGDTIPEDPALEALIAPYREKQVALTEEVIAVAAGPVREGDPEGPLGNFAADAMLIAARTHSARPVHLALTNNGGLRAPILEGPVTVGSMFEVMPFENLLTILDLTGQQIDSLAQDIARAGGEPIAGFSFSIDQNPTRAVNILVGNRPLFPDSTYRLVTSDYLANGGGRLQTLWEASDREDLPILLRDTYIEHARRLGTLIPRMEGRIVLFEENPR